MQPSNLPQKAMANGPRQRTTVPLRLQAAMARQQDKARQQWRKNLLRVAALLPARRQAGTMRLLHRIRVDMRLLLVASMPPRRRSPSIERAIWAR